MKNPKPWEDFDTYRLQLKIRRLEQEKRLSEDWQSLRNSWKENGEWIRKQAQLLSSGESGQLIWGPVGRFVFDLIRTKLFRSKKNS
jgi:hypothetical protein